MNNAAKLKRILDGVETLEEMRPLMKLVNERYRAIDELERKRERKAKLGVRWEMISALPAGAKVIVNLSGDHKWPRGTALEIDRIENEGRRQRAWLKGPDGKVYWCNKAGLESFDIKSANEFDPSKIGPMLIAGL